MRDAILLIGPTGSGKTPLGDALAAGGLGPRGLAHFDFGAQLRAAAQDAPGWLTGEQLTVVRRSLETGALLENRDFGIAAAILSNFEAQEGMAPDGIVIMNGLPRHVSQARDTDALVRIRAVAALHCTPQTVCERLRLNSGGDRTGRVDDQMDLVARKLEIFEARTKPILDRYAGMGVVILPFEVGVQTGPGEIMAGLMPGLTRVFLTDSPVSER